jgi:hypothetical protein
MEQEAMMQPGMEQPMPQQPVEGEVVPEEGMAPEAPQRGTDEEEQEIIMAIMEEQNLPENVAMAMREAELGGYDDQEIMQLKEALLADMEQVSA